MTFIVPTQQFSSESQCLMTSMFHTLPRQLHGLGKKRLRTGAHRVISHPNHNNNTFTISESDKTQISFYYRNLNIRKYWYILNGRMILLPSPSTKVLSAYYYIYIYKVDGRARVQSQPELNGEFTPNLGITFKLTVAVIKHLSKAYRLAQSASLQDPGVFSPTVG